MNLLSNFNTSQLYLLGYMILINLGAFIFFGIDKRKAKTKQWRIPESTLLVLCLVGGATGGIIGMVIFKHKVSKPLFYIGVPTLIILNKIVELLITNHIFK